MKATITISRQMGSGGSYLGKLIAERLGMRYIDREVLYLLAREFGVDPSELTGRAEKLSSFWQKVLRGFSFGSPESHYTPPSLPLITDVELFEKQTEIMKILAIENNSVIVGWGGSFVLPAHGKSLSIFCHAPLSFRVKRVMEVYKIPDEKNAAATIAESDNVRRKYISQMTGKDWMLADNYDLSINTSLLSFEKIADLFLEIIKLKNII